jgi:hypothetical protein
VREDRYQSMVLVVLAAATDENDDDDDDDDDAVVAEATLAFRSCSKKRRDMSVSALFFVDFAATIK